MALHALQVRVPVGQLEARCRVIEGRPAPARHCRVATVASRREVRLDVVRTGRALVVRHVAVGASPVGDIVIAELGGVALYALHRRMGARQRETRRSMIERRPAPPGRRRMARLARLREVSRDVAGIVRVVEIIQVARNTRGVRKAEVVIRMALRAKHIRVRARQREPGSGVIETGRTGPIDNRRAVAEGTVVRESGGLVGWVVGVVEVRKVAADAGSIRQAEVVVGVARRALLCGVGANQRKAGCGMVERGAVPIGCGVAQRTIQREAPCLVGRVGRAVKVRQVAVDAGAAGQPKVVIRVALGALHTVMRTSQSETGGGVVEVGDTGPVELRHAVANRAVRGIASRKVRRVSGLVEVREVAVDTSGAGQREIVIDVAGSAVLRHRSVRPYERETRELCVVEARAIPRIDPVAGFAGGWQFRRHVVGLRGLLIILQMARHAFRAKAVVDSTCRAEVALIAGSRGVGAQQRKAIVMLLNRRDSHIPAPNSVTFLAVGAELTPMEIGVAIRTASGRFREHQADMTTLARNIRVQAQQLKAGLPVMIEFRLPAGRCPCGRGVTVFAGNLQVAVRTRCPAAD